MSLPFVSCLCPTYGRPAHLIANTIRCFLDQTYPAANRELIILDDMGNITIDAELRDQRVVLISTSQRYANLPDKYNFLREFYPDADIQLVWEDDDLYLPHHVSSYVAAMQSRQWAHPTHVWSTYTGKPEIEQSGGRFHAALGFQTKFLTAIGGWPQTHEANFDQQLISTAAQTAIAGLPNSGPDDSPSYVFRWTDTGATHGQSTMGDDGDWYQRYKPQNTNPVHISADNARYDKAAVATIRAIQQLTSREGTVADVRKTEVHPHAHEVAR